MVGSMCFAWGEVGHPRLVRRNRMEQANPFDGLVRHILVEEIVLVVVWRLDRLDVFEDGRSPLAGITTDKAVEIFKSQSGRPQVEWPDLAVVPIGHVVILAIPRGVVGVLVAQRRVGAGAF